MLVTMRLVAKRKKIIMKKIISVQDIVQNITITYYC